MGPWGIWLVKARTWDSRSGIRAVMAVASTSAKKLGYSGVAFWASFFDTDFSFDITWLLRRLLTRSDVRAEIEESAQLAK